ncbi:MAG TPA: hypothetical protein VI006_02995 [Solirubrobacteraceae bacterium]|jgi:hypothetical protein
MSETSRHHRSVRVPAAQAAAVHEALVTTYAVKADALAVAAGGDAPAVVQDARRELAEAEDALDAVGWQVAPGEGFELAGAAGLVREVLYGALLAVAEAVGERCREYEAGRAGRDELARAVGDVVVVHELFDRLEALDAL